jgi:hypothetical protein
METPEKKFNQQEAMKVLNETISVAKGNLDDGYFYFVLWGSVIALIYLSRFCLIRLNLQDYSGYTNLLYAVGGIISIIFSRRQDKKPKVNTYIEKWMGYIWIGFGMQLAVAIVCLILLDDISIITPVFLLLIGGATFISGGLIKYKPLILGGVIFIVFAIATFFISAELQNLLACISMIMGNLIPGLMYRQSLRKENV